jgi:2-C-methyl-D-erythritol 2,4-cyclodiphosphate synthase
MTKMWGFAPRAVPTSRTPNLKPVRRRRTILDEWFLDAGPVESYDPPRQQFYQRGILTMSALEFRVGLGHDMHRLIHGRPLILGGVRVPHDRGLLGHSDADIVMHAVTDALLGAAGLGDIGDFFPNTDPRYAGADSSLFVKSSLDRLHKAGWRVVNLDCTISAQRPKLATYKSIIRQSLAQLLAVELEAVNVKAKTGEQVGPVGREEAMAADAIVLIARSAGRRIASRSRPKPAAPARTKKKVRKK